MNTRTTTNNNNQTKLLSSSRPLQQSRTFFIMLVLSVVILYFFLASWITATNVDGNSSPTININTHLVDLTNYKTSPTSDNVIQPSFDNVIQPSLTTKATSQQYENVIQACQIDLQTCRLARQDQKVDKTPSITRLCNWQYLNVLLGWQLEPLLTTTSSSRRPQSVRVKLEHPLIVQLRQVMEKYKSPSYVQFFDHSFLEMTYNWLCNVVPFRPLLDRVVFVVTDVQAYNAIAQFSKTQIESRGQPPLRLVLVEYKPIQATGNALTYGELQYYDYMFFRSGLMLQLLAAGIDFMVVESDSVWFSDPSSVLFSYQGDFVTGLAGDGPFDGERVGAVEGVRLGTNRGVQHGFSLFRSNSRTIDYYATVLAYFEDMINNKHDGHENEQGVIVKLLKKFPELKFQFFEENQFRHGMYWFPKDLPPGAPKPIIIQNNYIIGGDKKLARAKEAGYWYLNDKNECDEIAMKNLVG
jgi:hypothetical protein